MTLDFSAVFDLNEYQDIQDTLSGNLGVSSITVLPSGKPLTLPSNFSRLCKHYIRTTKKGRKNCYKCNAEIGQISESGPVLKQCMENKGLWNAGVSIIVDGVHIATWCIGQVKNEQVDEDHILAFGDKIEADPEDFKKALDEIPYMSKERFSQIADLLFLFVNQLAKTASKNRILKHQISEIKNSNEMLFRMQKRFRLLFEQSNDAIFVVNLPDGRYVDANESALKLTGRSWEEIIKLKTSDLTPTGASKRLNQIMDGKFNKSATQVDYLRPDGTVRQAKLSAIPIDQHSLFGIAQDVTEQLKATEALKHSHDLMQYIIEHSRSAIAVHDKELRYIYVSQKYLEEYGIQEKNIIGKHHYEVFPDLPQKWREVHQKALQGIISSAEEDPYMREDGSVDWTRWECRPWYDQNKEIGGIVVYTEVITKRKQMEIELRESEEKYKFLFYSNPQPSWIYDLESLSFLEINDAAVLHYGYSREEFLKMKIKDIRAKEDIQRLMEAINIDLTPQNNEGVYWRHRKKNGEFISVQVFSHQIEYKGRKAGHVLINDITNQLASGLEIRAAKEKAEESDRLKSAFLANISHEIRTPLNSILGFSELLIDPDFDESDREEFVEIMKQNSDRLLTLIDSILDISKIEAGQLQLKNFAVPLQELLISIQKNHQLAAQKKGLELIANTAGLEHETEILTDGHRLAQILTNLLYNAIKFTEKGVIEFGSHISGNYFYFYVKDTGIGIPQEFHERIFERFWQVDRGLSRKFEGSGLGLTITKSLVELLGGKIWLESTVDKGTTFYFSIPRPQK